MYSLAAVGKWHILEYLSQVGGIVLMGSWWPDADDALTCGWTIFGSLRIYFQFVSFFFSCLFISSACRLLEDVACWWTTRLIFPGHRGSVLALVVLPFVWVQTLFFMDTAQLFTSLKKWFALEETNLTFYYLRKINLHLFPLPPKGYGSSSYSNVMYTMHW